MTFGRAVKDDLDSCRTRNCMDVDYNTLGDFIEGAPVGNAASRTIKKLSSRGLIRQGITEESTPDGRIMIVPTAKGTAFAKQVLHVRK